MSGTVGDGAGYTFGEITWLLSLTHAEAVDIAASPRDSCCDVVPSDDPSAIRPVGDADSVSLIARWADVQRARQAVHADREAVFIVSLYGKGFPEAEIAKRAGVDRSTLRRRWRATATEILAHLGREPDKVVTSHVSLCLHCGQRPRARVPAIRHRIPGRGRVVTRPERQASVCTFCLRPDLHPVATG